MKNYLFAALMLSQILTIWIFAQKQLKLVDGQNGKLSGYVNGEVETLPKAILFDFRNEESFLAPQKIKGAEADAVLKYVFGASYKTAADASVDQRIYGEFTKPDVRETLYFIRGGLIEEQENLSRGEVGLLSYIAVFEGSTPFLQSRVAAY
jgi:hypothetical protein